MSSTFTKILATANFPKFNLHKLFTGSGTFLHIYPKINSSWTLIYVDIYPRSSNLSSKPSSFVLVFLDLRLDEGNWSISSWASECPFFFYLLGLSSMGWVSLAFLTLLFLEDDTSIITIELWEWETWILGRPLVNLILNHLAFWSSLWILQALPKSVSFLVNLSSIHGDLIS